jgi:hypothetical protein
MSTSALPARNILRHYRAATDDAIVAGTHWYEAALAICRQAVTDHHVGLEQAVCALAHLSSRLPWTKNVEAFSMLVSGQPRPTWVLSRSWQLASAALAAADPWSTFGRRASKTRSFAQAILGDENAVTVDIWAARVAGIDPAVLARPREYAAVADAYRRAARRVGISPRALQAITWCFIRGRAA